MHVLMHQLEQLKQEYQLSTAYHEASHEVVCIAQKIPIREFGLRIDTEGHGDRIRSAETRETQTIRPMTSGRGKKA